MPPSTTTFQSNVSGIRVGVPDGWVVDERFNGSSPISEQIVRDHGGKYVVTTCPQDQALPTVGGLYSCQLNSSTETGRGVTVYSFPKLQTSPDFAAIARENKSITTSDLLGHYLDLNRELWETLPPYVEIISNTDIAVNVTDSQTNKTIGTVPAKYVEFSETDPAEPTTSYKEFALVVLSNDTNTGYVVRPFIQEGLETRQRGTIICKTDIWFV